MSHPRNPASPLSTHSGCVRKSYLSSALVGELLGIHKLGEVWMDDSEANLHMTRAADLMCTTRAPPPDRSRIILGHGLNKAVQ